MIRNFSLILEIVAESTAKATVAQQRSLDSLARSVFDNREAPEYFLAEHEGICTVVNTNCYIRINTSGEGETKLYKITEQAS